MCGIAGAIGGRPEQVERMMQRIKHRGPDGIGLQVTGEAVHGHVRLALVDLTTASSQPFQRGQGTLSFNGEVWNFRELRRELEAQGETFTTTGDTEVLASFLTRFGLGCLSRLDGMFAFAWSDGSGGHWLVRDSFGKVPLYVAKVSGGFQWASERKAFAPGIKPIAVPPGHAFNLVTGGWVRWYRLPPSSELTPEAVLTHLRRGVAQRLQADAPVCCLVSGGLDSSVILALAKEQRPDLTAYTAVFNPDSEDAIGARRICAELGVPLSEVRVEASVEDVERAIQSIEIPSKAQIEIATLCLPLARRIQADGFKACLSGESADELFGGYGNFCIASSGQPDSEVVKLRKALLEKMARGNFIRCNKAFMAHGVECRLPYMEQPLVEAAIQCGLKSSPAQKRLLKDAVSGLVPSWVVKRKKDTFQGGSGVSDHIAKLIAWPERFYRANLETSFGYVPET